MSQDLVLATNTILKANATVAALIGTRAFRTVLPKAEAQFMPRYALVTRRAPGTGGFGGYLELERAALDIWTHGATDKQADTLYQAVREALKQARRQVVGSVLVHGFEAVGSPSSDRPRDTPQWPVVFSSWSVIASEAAAA